MHLCQDTSPTIKPAIEDTHLILQPLFNSLDALELRLLDLDSNSPISAPRRDTIPRVLYHEQFHLSLEPKIVFLRWAKGLR